MPNCETGKIAYPNAQAAWVVARQMSQRRRPRGGSGDAYAYRCASCRLWHTSSSAHCRRTG